MTGPRRPEVARVTVRAAAVGAPRLLVAVIVFVGLVVAGVGSLGAPLITVVAVHYSVSLSAA